jgi:hypothetical protein
MIEMYQDHCEVIKDSLSGKRTIDEQTLASVAVLDERLQQVKKLGGRFSSIRFSPAVEQIQTCPSKVAVG